MSDLVERLRYEPGSTGLQDEAADYIEALEADRKHNYDCWMESLDRNEGLLAELATLRAQIKRAEEQEPVAWGNLAEGFDDHDRVLITDKDKAENYSRNCYPLTSIYTKEPKWPQTLKA